MNQQNQQLLRVVFCLNGPNAVNGPNVWLTRHLPLLAARNIEPLVLYLSWDPNTPCSYRHLLETAGIRTVPLRLGRFVEDNAIAIAERVDSLTPDVFVPNYSVAGYYAARFLRETGVLTVGTLHSDDPYYHDLIDVFLAGPELWRLSGAVGVSEYLRAFTAERVGGEFPFLHAPYGAPTPSDKAHWTPRRFRLVYSGRLVEPQKRIRRVIAAMEEAVQKSPEIEGVLYGDGPERPQVERLISVWNGRIRFGGLLNPVEMQTALLEGQAFVLLSDFEGLSIALMEAMACGLVPIVTPMRSGVNDLIEDGVTGFIVPPDDSAAFAGAVMRLASDAARWQLMSNAAREVVIRKGFTAESCADSWVDFLIDLSKLPPQKQQLSIPPYDQWAMPPRSLRPDGIRLEDRRVAWPKMRAVKAAGRPLFLWGASRAGEAFLDMINGHSLPVTGFIDSDPAKRGQSLQGLSIYTPEQFHTLIDRKPRPFVVITSQFETEIAAAAEAMGLQENQDYIAG